MDRYEYKLKVEQLEHLLQEKDYETAAEIADTINWRKVRSAATLCMVGEIYDRSKRYEDSREILLMAYDRAAVGRNVLYRLTLVALKMGNVEEAKDYYEEFLDVAPHDNSKYVLRYQIAKLEGASLQALIGILEEFKERDYTEEWAFELAYLYHRAGDGERCVEACDELELWYGDGKYVEKALEMKMLYQPLDQRQEEKYRQFKRQKRGRGKGALAAGSKAQEGMPEITPSPNRFNTANLQAELAKSMQQIMDANTQEKVSDTMDNIKRMVKGIPYLQVPVQGGTLEAEGQFGHIETEEEIDQSLNSQFNEMLAEEWDGQYRMHVPAGDAYEPQVEGQMNIDDVLSEWERTQRAYEAVMENAKQRKLESAKARAWQEAQELLERLNHIIPELEAGVSSQELLEERYLQGGGQGAGRYRGEDAGNAWEGNPEGTDSSEDNPQTGSTWGGYLEGIESPGYRAETGDAWGNGAEDAESLGYRAETGDAWGNGAEGTASPGYRAGTDNAWGDSAESTASPEYRAGTDNAWGDSAESTASPGYRAGTDNAWGDSAESTGFPGYRAGTENVWEDSAEGTAPPEYRAETGDAWESNPEGVAPLGYRTESGDAWGNGAEGTEPPGYRAGTDNVWEDSAEGTAPPEYRAGTGDAWEGNPEGAGTLGPSTQIDSAWQGFQEDPESLEPSPGGRDGKEGSPEGFGFPGYRTEPGKAKEGSSEGFGFPRYREESGNALGRDSEEGYAQDAYAGLDNMKERADAQDTYTAAGDVPGGFPERGNAPEEYTEPGSALEGFPEGTCAQDAYRGTENIPGGFPEDILSSKGDYRGGRRKGENAAAREAAPPGIGSAESYRQEACPPEGDWQEEPTQERYVQKDSIQGSSAEGGLEENHIPRTSPQEGYTEGNVGQGEYLEGTIGQNENGGMDSQQDPPEEAAGESGQGQKQKAHTARETSVTIPSIKGFGRKTALAQGILAKASNMGDPGIKAVHLEGPEAPEGGSPQEGIVAAETENRGHSSQGMEPQERDSLETGSQDPREPEGARHRLGQGREEAFARRQERPYGTPFPAHSRTLREAQKNSSIIPLEKLIEKQAEQETARNEDKDAEHCLESAFRAAKASREEKHTIPKIELEPESPSKAKLSPEQREIFSYFVPVVGMEQQLCQVLEGVARKKEGNKTSSSGNIVIMGGKGSGKTVLATDFIKAIQKGGAQPNGKVGKIAGGSLNQKDLSQLLKKVAGGYLIIERAGEMDHETVTRLALLMDQDTNGLLVILEDTRKGMEKVLSLDVNFAKKFTERIKIPVFTSDELVEFAKAYAAEQECEIDDMGILALYNRISNIQKLDEATTLTEVKEIVDEAISSAERGGLKKLFGRKKFSPEGYLYLRERDFDD
ncbi:MAG: hypothetical protein HFH38_12150 [Lachnospiraceae bacterium]|nr:hypothetical protein [Lachnospiraceae bacterium]